MFNEGAIPSRVCSGESQCGRGEMLFAFATSQDDAFAGGAARAAPAAVALRVRLRSAVHVRAAGPRALFRWAATDARPHARPLAPPLVPRAEGQTRALAATWRGAPLLTLITCPRATYASLSYIFDLVVRTKLPHKFVLILYVCEYLQYILYTRVVTR